MARLLAVLQTLGAVRQRDGGLVLELAPLELTSLFGGALVGAASCGVQGDALAFKTPPELAACGRLWLPDIVDDDALVTAIADAHGELQARISDAFSTLRRLGFKARLQAPEPRARGFVVVDGVEVMVTIDTSGDLVVESVDGLPVGNDVRRSLVAPEEATTSEALALLRAVVKASQRAAPRAMSQEELAELQAALSDDDDDDFSLDSDEAEPTAAGVPMPTRQPEPNSFERDGTLQVPRQQHTLELRVTDDDSDAGTLKVRSSAPPAHLSKNDEPALTARRASLLDEFDDDQPPPSPPSRVDIDLDFDSDEGFGFEEPEPTATRPVSTPQQTVQRRDLDSEEDDLLAALGDDRPLGAAGVQRSGNTAPVAPSVRTVDNTLAHPVAATRQEQPQVTDDDFEECKTRALVVDEALLAQLRLGDAAPAPQGTMPVQPTIHIDDLDLQAAAGSLLLDERDGGAGLDETPGDIDVDEAFSPSNTLPLPSAAVGDPDHQRVNEAHAAQVAALTTRELELVAELHEVQTALAALRAGTSPRRVARASQAHTPLPPAPVDQFAVVGASDEGAPQWDTRAAAASLPSMASVDVHEVRARVGDDAGYDEEGGFSTGHSSILDAFDDDGPVGGGDSDDDVVSFAALQGALNEMGVDLGDGNATQVAAAIPFPLPADDAGDDGDVFGSGLGSSLPRREHTPSPASVASDLSVEATRVRQARPAAIGLVVEDERARQRLRKHLVDRFAELFEAEDATEAMQQRSFSDVDAIVFIRPSDTERTAFGFSRLESMPRRPRVLVISSDEHFDDSPAVDLRLPLAQKASDVARQVLDGLERLGVHTSVL